MNFLLQVTVILLVQLSQLWAFRNGLPLSTCESMFPRHRVNRTVTQPQTRKAPYNITVSKSSYTAGENLTVTISGSTTFNGFVLNARGIDSSVAWPVGEFIQIPINDAQYLYCSGGEPQNTVAHNNTYLTDWNSFQFTWMAPTKSAGNISFVATIVHKYETFWTNVSSSVVTGPPAENVTRGVTTESFQINKTGCGKTKGCYSLPPKCTGSADCNYLFTYKVVGENAVIEMSAKEHWVSVAFNEQKKMDKMDSILCVTMPTNLAELRHYSSRRHRMDRQNLAGNSDLTLTTIAYEDGGIKCRVSRKLTSSEAHFRDLTNKWYLLFAHGTTGPSGSAQNHGHINRTFTAETVDLSVPATLVDEQSQDTVSKDGCGKTKSCYSEPESCKSSSDCEYLVTLRPVGEKGESGEVEIEISGKKEWVSIGFNKEKMKMPGTDALICTDTHHHGRVSVDHYVVKGYDRPTKTSPRPGSIVKDFGESRDGVVSCRFRRKMNDDKMVNLTEPWYLVYSSGPMSGGLILKHSTTPRTSPEKVKVDDIRALISKDGCGKTKSCYSEPESCKSSSDCDYLVTLRPVGEKGESGEVEIEISGKNQWVSIGFNKEKMKMPGTDALICAEAHRGKVSVDHYVVKGYDIPTKTSPSPGSIVKDFGQSSGGVVSCRFRRKMKDDKMVDLTEPWYLVYSCGPMNGDTIGKHSTTPRTSPEKVKVDDIRFLGAEKVDAGMIRAHGCLMVIAWVGFASIAIFMARYMKVAFGDKVLLGTKVWFTCHRLLMVLTVLVTIIAIIIIFVHAGRWTEEAGAHPITGIIVLVLAVIQPIMALFRPLPEVANRFIFNWAHRGVGLAALILAVVTVFLGIRLPGASLDDSALYAMIAYCVGVAIVIMFEVYLSLKKNRNAATFSPLSGEDKEGGHVQLKTTGEQFVSARQQMLGFLVLFVTGVVIALVVLIATAEEGHQH